MRTKQEFLSYLDNTTSTAIPGTYVFRKDEGKAKNRRRINCPEKGVLLKDNCEDPNGFIFLSERQHAKRATRYVYSGPKCKDRLSIKI